MSAPREALAQLGALPLVASLSDEQRAALFGQLVLRPFGAGEVLLAEGDDAGALHFVVSGELEAVHRGRVVAVFEDAPAVVGLLGVVDGRPRSASVVARTAGQSWALPQAAFDGLLRDAPGFARAVTAELVRLVRLEHERNLGQQLSFHDCFASPNARLVAPPKTARRVRQLLVFGALPAAVATPLLPPGYVAGPGPETFAVLAFSRELEQAAPTSELVLAFAARDERGAPAVCVPEIFADSFRAIALGRELFALPKRFGGVRWSRTRVDVDASGEPFLHVGWSDGDGAPAVHPGWHGFGRWLSPHADAPQTQVVVRREVPEPKLDGRNTRRVDEVLGVRVVAAHEEPPRWLAQPQARAPGTAWAGFVARAAAERTVTLQTEPPTLLRELLRR